MGEIFKKELPNSTLPFTSERFTDGHDIETEMEHSHRYFFARSYCRGKDVLDIASGEGYGSAILAQVASSVIGVDICEEAVSHAQNVHGRDNLRYLTGDVRKIPLEDNSVDVVVSFETLEHFYEHDLFMQEVKRVLRQGGCLIISTPNSDIYSAIGIPANPYHINELTKPEFTLFCKKYFKYMSTVNQRTMVGSILITENEDTTGLPLLFESRDDEHVESSKGLSRAYYLISILSDENEITALNSVYISNSIRDLNSKLQFSQHVLEEKNNLIVNMDTHIANLENTLLDKNKYTENLENDISNKGKHIENIERIILENREHIANLENDILNKGNYIENIENILLENNKYITKLENDVFNIANLENDILNKGNYIENIENILLENNKYITKLENDVFNKKKYLESIEKKFLEKDKKIQLLNLGVKYSKRRGAVLTWIKKLILNRKAIRVCSDSIFFDANWYWAQNPDVKEAGINPFVHYVKFGASEFRDPGPNFSTINYLLDNPKVLKKGINPLLHFEQMNKISPDLPGKKVTIAES